MTTSFDYSGDTATGQQIAAAFARVIDPEMALDIVSLGLVYSVEARPGHVRARITMTSAACPVADLIVADIEHELRQALGEGTEIETEIVWEPPWAPERMSSHARGIMGWD
ncbi:MAG TPA: metal-sulfur cluster assembly factor [Usitatibacter sp.]|nr:metal-sulfur cluster assembly factor [Usitatibacter sp.]